MMDKTSLEAGASEISASIHCKKKETFLRLNQVLQAKSSFKMLRKYILQTIRNISKEKSFKGKD